MDGTEVDPFCVLTIGIFQTAVLSYDSVTVYCISFSRGCKKLVYQQFFQFNFKLNCWHKTIQTIIFNITFEIYINYFKGIIVEIDEFVTSNFRTEKKHFFFLDTTWQNQSSVLNITN
jgi:hypothetical protein